MVIPLTDTVKLYRSVQHCQFMYLVKFVYQLQFLCISFLSEYKMCYFFMM